MDKEMEENIKLLKKNIRKLRFLACINFILGFSFLILFVVSFIIDVFIESLFIKLFWLLVSFINFSAVYKCVSTINISKKFLMLFG